MLMADNCTPPRPIPARGHWAIFAESIVSSVGNPDALLLRVLGRTLVQAGHEVTFYEPRRNPALLRLLRRDGARGLDAFRRAHPDLPYRTMDERAGADLVEWLTRTLATADVALVQSGAPATLTTWIGRLTRPHLRTYLLETGWNAPLAPEDRAAREPANFSGICAGAAVAPAYRAYAPPERLLLLGALPDPSELDTPAACAQLEAVARELVAGILAEPAPENDDRRATTDEAHDAPAGRTRPLTR